MFLKCGYLSAREILRMIRTNRTTNYPALGKKCRIRFYCLTFNLSVKIYRSIDHIICKKRKISAVLFFRKDYRLLKDENLLSVD